MSSETISTMAGLLLSLVFSYVPRVRDEFDALSPTAKRGLMGACIVAVGCFSFAWGCAGLTDAIACDRAGAVGLLRSIVAALVANQAMYLITPTSGSKQ